MQLRKRQAGMGMLGWILALCVGAFVLNCVLKLGPIYMEYWQLKKALNTTMDSPGAASMSKHSLYASIEKQLEVNGIDSVTTKTIKVTQSRDERELNANYEKRVPFLGNIDIVVKFNDLVYKLAPGEGE